MQQIAVYGTTAQPDHDSAAFGVEDLHPKAVAIALQFLAHKNIPMRPEWSPKRLAQDLGGGVRTWQRRCELGEIVAIRDGRDYIVILPWLVRYYAQRQNVVEMN